MKIGVPYTGEPAPVFPEGLTIDGFPVRFDRKLDLHAQARGLLRGRNIVVGPRWLYLRPAQQWAILLHEVGHLKGYHLLRRLFWLPLCWSAAAQRLGERQELEADAYAAAKGYGADLLTWLRAVYVRQDSFYPDFKAREANLLRRTKEYSDANLP